MSKKDFDFEFSQIEAQYFEMVNDLKEMQEDMANGAIEPEAYDKLKKIVDPIIANYRVWDYIRFVLNKPVNKKSRRKYEKNFKKEVKCPNTLQNMKKENQLALDELKEF